MTRLRRKRRHCTGAALAEAAELLQRILQLGISAVGQLLAHASVQVEVGELDQEHGRGPRVAVGRTGGCSCSLRRTGCSVPKGDCGFHRGDVMARTFDLSSLGTGQPLYPARRWPRTRTAVTGPIWRTSVRTAAPFPRQRCSWLNTSPALRTPWPSQPCSIRLIAVHRAHLEAGHDSPAMESLVKRTMQGIRRTKGTAQRRVKCAGQR
jgi:hypothetical protein